MSNKEEIEIDLDEITEIFAKAENARKKANLTQENKNEQENININENEKGKEENIEVDTREVTENDKGSRPVFDDPSNFSSLHANRPVNRREIGGTKFDHIRITRLNNLNRDPYWKSPNTFDRSKIHTSSPQFHPTTPIYTVENNVVNTIEENNVSPEPEVKKYKQTKVVKRKRNNPNIKKKFFTTLALASLVTPAVLNYDNAKNVVSDTYTQISYNPKKQANKSYKKDVIDLDKNDDINLNTSDYLLLKAIESGEYNNSEKLLELSTVVPYLVNEYNSNSKGALDRYKKAESFVRENSGIILDLADKVVNQKLNEVFQNDSSYKFEFEEVTNFEGGVTRKLFITNSEDMKIDLNKNNLGLPKEILGIASLKDDFLNNNNVNAISDDVTKGRDAKNLANIVYLTKELDQRELELSEKGTRIVTLGKDESKSGYSKLSDEMKYEKISKYNKMVEQHKQKEQQLEEYEKYKYDEYNVISDFIEETTNKGIETSRTRLDEDFER